MLPLRAVESRCIGGFKRYHCDSVVVRGSAQTIVTQVYQNGFQQFNDGVAVAQAFVLLLIIAVVAVFQFRATF